MDTSDPDIEFDGSGICGHCRKLEQKLRRELPDADAAASRLAALVDRIKADGRGKPFDCIIGLSGGVDSTYVALKVAQLGLRPFAIHLDNGWNSELAVKNIENTVKTLRIDLSTHVLNWPEFSDLQRSFFLASVVNCEMPTDHAIVATLFRHAAKFGLRYVISGSNLATEGMGLPEAWGHDNKDWTNIRDIHARHGKVKLASYPHLSFASFCWNIGARGIRFVPILNLLGFRKAEAIRVIESELGWRNYGRKHGESIFTRFYQEHYLPVKFGYDKRRVHLSTLVMTGQISRPEALRQLEEPLFRPEELVEYRTLFLKKLRFSEGDWERILKAAPVPHRAYRHNGFLSDRNSRLYRFGRNLATSRSRNGSA
jgi:N-acetyl sugar amidotransferase